MATTKLPNFKTVVHKPMGDDTVAMSVSFIQSVFLSENTSLLTNEHFITCFVQDGRKLDEKIDTTFMSVRK